MSIYANVSPWIMGSAILGVITLYMVVATLVGREVYKKSSGSDSDKAFSAFMVGGFFPITVPIGIICIVALAWIKALCSVKLGCEEETKPFYDSQMEDLNSRMDLLELGDDEKEDVPEFDESLELEEPKFKVGDVITGVSGNPDNYKVLYQGCKCRVLEINEKGSMKLVLVDHIHLEAHQHRLGNYFKAPSRNFELYNPESSKVKTTGKTKKK